MNRGDKSIHIAASERWHLDPQAASGLEATAAIAMLALLSWIAFSALPGVLAAPAADNIEVCSCE